MRDGVARWREQLEGFKQRLAAATVLGEGTRPITGHCRYSGCCGAAGIGALRRCNTESTLPPNSHGPDFRISSAPQPQPRIIAARMALQAGTRLGPYEVLSLIGAGGMGEVYRGPRPTLVLTGVDLMVIENVR